MSTIKNIILGSARSLTSARNHSFFVRRDIWTPDNVVKSPFKDVVIPNSTIPEHVWKNIEKWGEKTAVTCGLTNRRYTFSELHKYSRTFAANLRIKFKVTDNDVICVMMHNSPEYAIAALGILDSGAEMTTVNPIYTAHEVQRQIILSKPKVFIVSTETYEVLKEALKLSKMDLPIIVVKYSENSPSLGVDFFEIAKEENVNLDILKEVRKKSEDVAILPYSSGTTGLPKGVELTNRNIVVNCVQQDVDGVKLEQDTTKYHQDVVLAVLPFYHIYGLVIVLLHKLSVGAKVVTLPKFDPNTFGSSLKDHRVSLLFAAPPMILFMGKHPSVKKEHLETVDKVMSGAAPLHKEDLHRALEKMPSTSTIIQLYGLTETSPLATSNLVGSTNYTSSGYAVSNTELKVVDSELKSLGPDEVGELLIKGPQVMKGYRNNPEATKGCIGEDGWFRSGDLAFLDKQGAVTIVDRLKELIKVKGYQVAPAELESILKEHPAVLDAGVVGIPDERAGEVPKAFVVLKNGHKASDIDLMEFLKERVAEFKRVKVVEFLDTLPKNPSGKLLRRVLKDRQ